MNNNSFGVVESREEERRTMMELYDREDLFDVFIKTIINGLPTFYVLINITLLIWIAQTIFNSNLESIPRSIYLVSPYFDQTPISSIRSDVDCREGEERVALKTFPTIVSEQISHKKLYLWGNNSVSFCLTRVIDRSE